MTLYNEDAPRNFCEYLAVKHFGGGLNETPRDVHEARFAGDINGTRNPDKFRMVARSGAAKSIPLSKQDAEAVEIKRAQRRAGRGAYSGSYDPLKEKEARKDAGIGRKDDDGWHRRKMSVKQAAAHAKFMQSLNNERHEAVLNESRRYTELYGGALPTVVNTQNSYGLVGLYNQFHRRPGVKIVEGGISDDAARAYIQHKRDKAYRRALRQAERDKWPPAKQKLFALQAAKVAEKEAVDYIERMAARADADGGSKNEDAVSDFWKHYDKAGKNFDRRYNDSRAEMTNHALAKVLDKAGASASALPPNVRFRTDGEPNESQKLLEEYAVAGYGADEGYTHTSTDKKRSACRGGGQIAQNGLRQLALLDPHSRSKPRIRASIKQRFRSEIKDNLKAAREFRCREACGVDEGKRLRTAAMAALMGLSALGAGKAKADVGDNAPAAQGRPAVTQRYLGFQHSHPDSTNFHFRAIPPNMPDSVVNRHEKDLVGRGYRVVRKDIQNTNFGKLREICGIDERGSGSRLRRTKRRIGFMQHDLNKDFYTDMGLKEKDVQDSVQYMKPKEAKKVLYSMRKGVADKFTCGDMRKVPTQDKHRI